MWDTPYDSDPVYYKIGLAIDDTLTTICLQWFDESEYGDDAFLTDTYGDDLRFNTKEEAEQWMHSNVKLGKIHESHKKLKYMKHEYLLEKEDE